jgi:hypothetical protein
MLAAGLDLILVVVVTFGLDVLVAFIADSRGIDDLADRSWFVAVQYLVGAVLLLGVPLLRRDRATPGQLTVLLGLSSSRSGSTASRASVLARFAVRWLPILVWGVPAIAALAVIELVTVFVRRDRRSLAGLVGGTVSTTHDAIEEAGTGAAGEAAS